MVVLYKIDAEYLFCILYGVIKTRPKGIFECSNTRVLGRTKRV